MKGLQLIKICEQLWVVALNASNEGVAVDQNLRAVMDCSIKRASNERIIANRKQLWTAALEGRAMKRLQLIASSYGLQH